MNKSKLPYVAYLLRFWPVNSTEKPVWRAILESPHTGERRGFRDLKSLVAFLASQTGERVLVIEADELLPGEDSTSNIT